MMAVRNLSKMGYLDASKTAFLACDIQETFRKSIEYFDNLILVSNRMTAAANILNIPLYMSVQYPRGLGPISPAVDQSSACLVYEKTKFSMVTQPLIDDIKRRFPNKLDSVVLYGIEAHVCVEQTAMDLISQGIAVHIVAEGTFSRSRANRMLAFQRMREFGCHISSIENVLFKLMKDKNHPQFKELSKLVREQIPDTLALDSLQISKL